MSGAASNPPAPTARRVDFSNLDRILWPEVGWTKGQMVDYYATVADVLLPHLRGRPLTLGRWPTGVDDKGWYQTNCRGAPSWLRTAEIPASRGEATFRMCVVDDLDGLLWVANQGTVELHPYLSTADSFDEASALVFDLDPGPPAGLVECCRVALAVRHRLAAQGRVAVAKTSGAAGLHVYIAAEVGTSFAETRALAQTLAAELTAERPAEIVDGFTRAERAGRVLIDWRQNERGRSQVAPYSLRATPWPLVSTPVTWDEVEAVAASGDSHSLYFAPEQVVQRVARHGDLFVGALRS